MAYLQRPNLGLVYAASPGPSHGERGQLDLPRCERTIEAFSDISYASTKGYRSVQGQVYYYAGAPVMWNTNRQPFPTQSTAESELVGLCEALVGGRATAALVAAIRDEPEDRLVKRLWGDNAAAISLATGEGQGSWRTRHLRIRAAILRSALSRKEWHLGHLKGSELVADSFTKVVNGAAFERALQDLCIRTMDRKITGDGSACRDHFNAKVAMMVGATLLSGAAAAEEQETNNELSWFWTIGFILMSVGAVYVSSMIARSGIEIYKRLFGSSGGQFGEQGQRGDRLPCLRMLQHSSDEEERGVESEHRHGGSYAAVADMNELRQMVEQSRAIQCDPHNKMHGRSVRDWQDEDSDGSRPNVKLHTSDQLPRRRKKKGPSKRGQQRDEMNEEDVHRAWHLFWKPLEICMRHLHQR